MAVLLKNVVDGDRLWDPRTRQVPSNEKVVTFFYDLKDDKFVTHAPPSYISENGRIVFPGHTIGFKDGMLGQFNYCCKQNVAFMMTTKHNEQAHIAFFLHRVLRMKKKRLNDRFKLDKSARALFNRDLHVARLVHNGSNTIAV